MGRYQRATIPCRVARSRGFAEFSWKGRSIAQRGPRSLVSACPAAAVARRETRKAEDTCRRTERCRQIAFDRRFDDRGEQTVSTALLWPWHRHATSLSPRTLKSWRPERWSDVPACDASPIGIDG